MKTSKNRRQPRHQVYGANRLVGTLSITTGGRVFVDYPEKEKGIEVYPSHLGTAMHGDKVAVEIFSDVHKNGRFRGKVLEVVERVRTHFLGHVNKSGGKMLFHAEAIQPLPVFSVNNALDFTLHDGDRVMASWHSWIEGSMPCVSIEKICNDWHQTKWTYHQLLLEKGFSTSFKEETQNELLQLNMSFKEKEVSYRKDYRSTLTFTIDPADAKDFDDAISFREIRKDLYEVGVHIADVTHFIREGTMADKEAYHRATSVYMPGYVSPMLPEYISNDLCSLVPHEDRLCFAIIMEVDTSARVQRTTISKTLIHSDHRFTYEDVQKIIDKKKGRYKEAILLLYKLTQAIRAKRIKNGAINFSSREVGIQLDSDLSPVGVEEKESGTSHQLIEELMLLANQEVAKFLSKHKPTITFPSRVHALPDQEKLVMFARFAKEKGYKIARRPELLPESLNRMIADLQKSAKSEKQVLEHLAIRCMAKAEYATKAIGHYGLHFQHYAHFTSPIRRYPDILVHRILFDVLRGKQQRRFDDLAIQCAHCNQRERAAMAIEREAKKFKIIEYVQPFVGDKFQAIITGCSVKGIWAEIIPHHLEGFISMINLEQKDKFEHLPEHFCLRGRKTGLQLRMGSNIYVKLIAASLYTRKAELEWISD